MRRPDYSSFFVNSTPELYSIQYWLQNEPLPSTFAVKALNAANRFTL